MPKTGQIKKIEKKKTPLSSTKILKELKQREAELAIIKSVQDGLASKLELQAIYDLVGDKIRDLFGVRIERIELNVRGQYVEVDNASSNYLCMNGEDVHVFWHGAVAPANWRVHWREASGQRAYSDWTMTPPAATACPAPVRS